MAWKKVESYRLGYSLRRKAFLFYYQLEGETSMRQLNPKPAEYVGLADLFRNGGPISYNTVGEYFVTAGEAIKDDPEC